MFDPFYSDIKPELLDLEPPMSPVAGPSHSTDENSMMMYMDQSSMSTMPGPSGYQDNSALVSTDSQPQGNYLSLFSNMPFKQEQESVSLGFLALAFWAKVFVLVAASNNLILSFKTSLLFKEIF